MEFVNKIIDLIKATNKSEEIDVNNNEYHVYLKDAHILIYLDTEEKTLKVEANMFDEGSAKIYHIDNNLEELM